MMTSSTGGAFESDRIEMVCAGRDKKEVPRRCDCAMWGCEWGARTGPKSQAKDTCDGRCVLLLFWSPQRDI